MQTIEERLDEFLRLDHIEQGERHSAIVCEAPDDHPCLERMRKAQREKYAIRASIAADWNDLLGLVAEAYDLIVGEPRPTLDEIMERWDTWEERAPNILARVKGEGS